MHVITITIYIYTENKNIYIEKEHATVITIYNTITLGVASTIQAAPVILWLFKSSIIIILLKKIPYNFSMHIHIITVIDFGVIAIFLIWTLMINNH